MSTVPQFGEREPGRDYPDRPAAFGVVLRAGLIALVRVEKPDAPAWRDLPGGALDAGETEAQALVREFGEETGLVVQADACFARADQFFLNTEGRAFNNRAAFWTARAVGEEPSLKIEDDHALIWVDPHEAISTLRHDAHAWAVAAWLRSVARPPANR
jgi:8-oxo-dGTP diphosphatase